MKNQDELIEQLKILHSQAIAFIEYSKSTKFRKKHNKKCIDKLIKKSEELLAYIQTLGNGVEVIRSISFESWCNTFADILSSDDFYYGDDN